jgi:hypothetical protein
LNVVKMRTAQRGKKSPNKMPNTMAVATLGRSPNLRFFI